MPAQRLKCYPYPQIFEFSHFCPKAICLQSNLKINHPTILKSTSMIVYMVTTWFLWILITMHCDKGHDMALFNISDKLGLTLPIWDRCYFNDKTCAFTMTTWSTIHLLQVLNCKRKGNINCMDIQWLGRKPGKNEWNWPICVMVKLWGLWATSKH